MDLRELAERLQPIAAGASEIALRARQSLVREKKPDGSIVTNADRDVETFLRKALDDLIPGAGFWGEEFGYSPETEKGLWLVDPIDGTTNFAYGSPLWGVSIGFAKGPEVLLGAVALPDLDETYIGYQGGGASCNGNRLVTVAPGQVEKYDPVSYNGTVFRSGPKLGKMRCSGCFVIDGTFTIRGRYRALVAIKEKLYDIAPCLLFARELGMQIMYADGSAFELEPLKIDRVIDRPWVMLPPGATLRA